MNTAFFKEKAAMNDADKTEPGFDDTLFHPSSASPSVQRVEVERLGEEDAAPQEFPGANGIHFMFSSQSLPGQKPPRLLLICSYLCLAAAWFFLGSRAPLTIFIGIPLNVVALFLGMLSFARGGGCAGLAILLLGTVGSLFVYLVGLFRFLAAG